MRMELRNSIRGKRILLIVNPNIDLSLRDEVNKSRVNERYNQETS